MPKYVDIKLEHRKLDPDSPFYSEMMQLRDLGSVFMPDENETFYNNLLQKYKFDLRIKYLKDILDIKRKYYYETSEEL